MRDIFFQEKSKEILLALAPSKKKYVSEITKDIDGTYAHTFNLIKEMEDLKIVSSKKEGRTKFVSLTPRGKELAKVMKEFLDISTSKKVAKPKVQKKVEPRKKESQQSLNKVDKYMDSIEALLGRVKAKKLKKKEVASYSRVLGRYRALVHRLRPRDKAGKDKKREAMKLAEEIGKILKSKEWETLK